MYGRRCWWFHQREVLSSFLGALYAAYIGHIVAVLDQSQSTYPFGCRTAACWTPACPSSMQIMPWICNSKPFQTASVMRIKMLLYSLLGGVEGLDDPFRH